MHLKKPEYHIILWFISLFLFWISVFFVQRQVFLLFHFSEVIVLPWREVLSSNWYALSLDTSAAAYLMIIPFFIITLTLAIRKQVNSMKIVHAINIILLSISILIGFTDIGLSLQWGTKMNSMALSYVDTSAEFSSLIFTSSNTLLFLSYFVLLSVCLFVYFKIFIRKTMRVKSLNLHIFITIFFLGFLMIAARGGLGKFPLDRSRVYFSVNPVLNNAALNGDWNLADLLVQPRKTVNPYQFFSIEKASSFYQTLYNRPDDTTESILTVSRPNIVMIIMESMGADVFSCLHGDIGITPGLDSLSKEALLFTNIYAAGSRTDQGLLALFSGYPTIPEEPVIRDFNKIEHLPHLCRTLNKAGYHTSYIIGGNLDYANTRGYMLTGETSMLVDGNDFPAIKRTEWGAYDEELFAEHIKLAGSFPQPFFSAISTITNHEEFNARIPRVWKVRNLVYSYRNTSHYTDRCVIQYLKEASSQSWFKNTLFVIVADHAHTYPFMRKYNEPERYHIPLILYGDVIRKEFRGRKITQFGSQYDIPYTLLQQINITPNEFTWGKDLLNPLSPGFAWFSFDNGFGYLTKYGHVVYDNNLKAIVQHDKISAPDTLVAMTNEGKAILQMLYEYFLELGRNAPHGRSGTGSN